MKRLIVIALLAALPIVAACGGGSSTSDTSSDPTFSTVDSLPKATGAMAGSASSSASLDLAKQATTGLNLFTTEASDFDANSSMGGCQMFNVVKQAIQSAAQADQILCFIQYMTALDEFQALGLDVYDGEWHIFNMDISGDEGAPDKVKMRIVRDAATNSITSFEMFMCSLSDNQLAQNEYTRQIIDGGALTMDAVGQHADSDGSWTGWHRVNVSGALNADVQYTRKTITMQDTGQGTSDDTHSQYGIFTQTPGAFDFQGYDYGGGSFNEEQFTYQDSVYGDGQMLGDRNALPTDLAMGDGAAQAYVSHTSGDQTWNPDPNPFVESWSGDTTDGVDSNEYTDSAAAGTLLDVGTVSISFETSETWDCTDDDATAVDLPTVDGTAMMEACSQYGSMQGSWVDCYQEIEQPQ